jgi:hypothetical protein
VKGYEALTEAQANATRALLAEESAQRTHVVIYLSGAHAYGFPSPDSDVDAKAIHVEPTRRLLGLFPSLPTAERMEVRDGVEVDYSSNELGQVVAGLLKGNGNYLERLLGETTLESGELHAELRELAVRTLSRRYAHHYRGFANQQLALAEKTPTAKKVLYVFRTALTGAHLLAAGRLVTDVNELLDEHGLGEVRELIALKQAGERIALPEPEQARWLAMAKRTIERIAEAWVSSPVPAEPEGVEALDAWLVETRAARV